MNLPNKLPIERLEDYHTHHLGCSRDGRLFWGYRTFVHMPHPSDLEGGDWQKYRREYAIFHTFDNTGKYLATKHFYGGTTDICDDAALEAKLQEWVAELGETTYTDIEVELFTTQIDGITFGLVPDQEFESIELQPSSLISFMEPWDGEYYTKFGVVGWAFTLKETGSTHKCSRNINYPYNRPQLEATCEASPTLVRRSF